jgi:hypothetical protein
MLTQIVGEWPVKKEDCGVWFLAASNFANKRTNKKLSFKINNTTKSV